MCIVVVPAVPSSRRRAGRAVSAVLVPVLSLLLVAGCAAPGVVSVPDASASQAFAVTAQGVLRSAVMIAALDPLAAGVNADHVRAAAAESGVTVSGDLLVGDVDGVRCSVAFAVAGGEPLLVAAPVCDTP